MELTPLQVESFLKLVWSTQRIREEILYSPCFDIPAPIVIMPPTALALLSPDAAEISIFHDRASISIPRYSSMNVMKRKLVALLPVQPLH